MGKGGDGTVEISGRKLFFFPTEMFSRSEPKIVKE